MRKYRLAEINPEKIAFDKGNPRGEDEDTISSDPEFEQLKDSVFQYGVLVPVVVHQQQSEEYPFRLVDGERRVRAALATGTSPIPAHVTRTEHPADDLVQAFHIHMLRKQWKNVAMVRALKRIIRELRGTGWRGNEDDLFEELRLQTGCTAARLKTLRRACRYTKAVLQDVETGKLGWSHLVQIEESAIEPLQQRLPNVLAEVGTKKARTMLLTKAKRSVIGTRSLMMNIAPVIARAKEPEQRDLAEALITSFLQKTDQTAEEVLRAYEKEFPSTDSPVIDAGQEIVEWASELRDLLTSFQPASLAGYPSLAKTMEVELLKLRKIISARISGIQRHRK